MMTTARKYRHRSRRVFRDRREAGHVMAELLGGCRGRAGRVIIGLARGGIPVAWEVAAALDTFIVRKLGAPGHPEFAIGSSGQRLPRRAQRRRGARPGSHPADTALARSVRSGTPR